MSAPFSVTQTEQIVQTPQGPKDSVGCLNCYWSGLVEYGADTCPECGHEGLVWVPTEDQEGGR